MQVAIAQKIVTFWSNSPSSVWDARGSVSEFGNLIGTNFNQFQIGGVCCGHCWPHCYKSADISTVIPEETLTPIILSTGPLARKTFQACFMGKMLSSQNSPFWRILRTDPTTYLLVALQIQIWQGWALLICPCKYWDSSRRKWSVLTI